MTVWEELLTGRAGLSRPAVDHLTLLMADWQILADLSFADLLLFVPFTIADGRPGYLCVGQMRPYTAQTIYRDDLVGGSFPATDRPMVGRAFADRRVIRDADPDWSTGVPIREEAIPVCLEGEIVAVVTREANVATARSPSQLELTYLQSAGEFAQMLAEGTFPYQGEDAEERELSPKVGDGIMRVDAEGIVSYASPNAISAYRRMGLLADMVGCHLDEFDSGSEALAEALDAGRPTETEVEHHGAIVQRRMLPLLGGGEVLGGLVLVREVTELRRHQRALRVKDATIQEIHHRVKNNLQTVASLLRLQGRRLRSQEAREALGESVRRISSIALVHEMLSQESRQQVDFDKIVQRVTDMLCQGLGHPDVPITFEAEGSAGDLPADVATPLALVLTELMQNCVEHAFPVEEQSRRGNGPGTIRTVFERGPSTLRILLTDNGVGLPEGESLEAKANLGLQIARTLVESELGGTFTSPPGGGCPGEGTSVELVLPLP